MDKWNIKFNVLTEMSSNSSSNFEIVYCDYAPNNIGQCLTAEMLNSNVHVLATVPLSLVWDGTAIKVRTDAVWSIGNTYYPLKAVFIRHKTNKYVMGFSINIDNFEVTNQVKIGADTVLWSIQDA